MKQIPALLIISAFNIAHVVSHATMVYPISWFDRLNWIPSEEGWKLDYIGMKSAGQCLPGCTIKASDICPKTPWGCDGDKFPGCSCMWFQNYTFVEKPTIYDPNLMTYAKVEHPSYFEKHPWRAPGTAHVDDPCGVAGGNLNGCINGNCSSQQGGYGYGPKATKFNFDHTIKVTEWKRGTKTEVAFGILANHGGGYSYRLCKVPKEGVSGLTEECFQKTPLKFVGDKQWVQYGDEVTSREEFPAVRTNIGTFPEESQWTKNPIPACSGGDGGVLAPSAKCPNGTQFPPPKPGLYGFGINIYHTVKPFRFSVVDEVYVPDDLEPGDYVLSFRWDCEQTPQVWNTCASILLH